MQTIFFCSWGFTVSMSYLDFCYHVSIFSEITHFNWFVWIRCRKILTRRDREGESATKMSEHKDRNQNCSAVTSGPACVTATEENGHISADDTLKNGVTPENNIPSSNSNTQQSVQSNRVNSPNSSRPSVNHRSGSPNSYSGSNAHSRGGSPQTGSSGGQSGNSPPNHQHVVHVHVNPGETFSVRLGDQIQHIQGRFCVHCLIGIT